MLLKTEPFFDRNVAEKVDKSDSQSESKSSSKVSDEEEVANSRGLDARIEALLRDWHQSPDLLFSIHPVDGSFLIW